MPSANFILMTEEVNYFCGVVSQSVISLELESYVDLCTVYFVAEFHSVDSFRVLDLAYNRKPK